MSSVFFFVIHFKHLESERGLQDLMGLLIEGMMRSMRRHLLFGYQQIPEDDQKQLVHLRQLAVIPHNERFPLLTQRYSQYTLMGCHNVCRKG